MHQAGHEPLQQLSLAEHDGRLVAYPDGDLGGAIRRLAARTSLVSSRARRANNPPAIAIATTSAIVEATLAVVLSPALLSEPGPF